MNNYSNQPPENEQNQEAQQMGQFLHNQHKKRKNKKKKIAKKLLKKLKKGKTKKAAAGVARAGAFILANLPLIGWILVGSLSLIVLLVILIILLDNVNPCKKSSSSSSDSGGPETTTKSYMATARAMWAECKHLGFTDQQAAGICGQAHQEDTTLNLDEWNSGCYSCGDHGHGLFQITPTSGVVLTQWCSEHHKNWRTPQAQVDCFVEGPWLKQVNYKESTKNASVATCAMKAAEAEGGGDIPGNSNEGNRASGAQWFYKKFHGQGSSDADSTASSSSSSDSACGQSTNSDSADGTGSIKEPPFSIWKAQDVPSDVKPYIHNPKDVGMSWGSAKGWYYPGGECADFAPSYFMKIWGIKSGPHPQGNGNQCVKNMKAYLKSGTVSSTPQAGDLASSNNSHMTTDPTYGHTWVVLHVLKNGDAIIAEENWKGYSGDENGEPETWNFQVIPKHMSETEYYHPSSKYHLRWNR